MGGRPHAGAAMFQEETGNLFCLKTQTMRVRNGYTDRMSYMELFFGKSKPLPPAKKASPEEMHLYSPEVEEEMVADLRRQFRLVFENLKGSHHPSLWAEVEESVREKEEDRILWLRMFFRQKRTGNPLDARTERR